VLSHHLENEDEGDQEIVVRSHFPSPNMDIQQDFQQYKVFQSCLSSPENGGGQISKWPRHG
jgi:hypothetical protein